MCLDTTSRIKVAKPVIDLDGDEMTRIIWAWIKEKVCADNLYSLCFRFSSGVSPWHWPWSLRPKFKPLALDLAL